MYENMNVTFFEIVVKEENKDEFHNHIHNIDCGKVYHREEVENGLKYVIITKRPETFESTLDEVSTVSVLER